MLEEIIQAQKKFKWPVKKFKCSLLASNQKRQNKMVINLYPSEWQKKEILKISIIHENAEKNRYSHKLIRKYKIVKPF